jgi:hypothetical protein
MSDVLLFGVLRMPYEMAMGSELSRRQFYARAQEAADRIEAAAQTENRTAYMCGTDFRHELRDASDGARIFSDVEDLRKHCPCADSCGVVEVRVEMVRFIAAPPEREGK